MKPSQNELAEFALEYPHRERIYNDSVQIVQTTTEVSTFTSRIFAIRDYIEWSFELLEKGYPVTPNQTHSEAIAKVNSFCNFHAVRIAKAISETVNSKRKALSAFGKVETLRLELCDARNRAEAEDELRQISQCISDCISPTHKTDTFQVRIDDLIRQLQEKYGFTAIPNDIIELWGDHPFDNDVVEVRTSIFDECAANKVEEELYRQEDTDVANLRLAGMELDGAGDIEGAIDKYIECINRGENATHDLFSGYAYAYERLFVCLRKVGRKEDEKLYIEKFLSYPTLTEYQRAKYTKRINLMNK